MLNILRAAWNDDTGAGLSEYGLLVAVILLIIGGTVLAIGTNANSILKMIFNGGTGHWTGR